MSNPIKNFTDLSVWQKSHRLYLEVLEDVKTLDYTEPGARDLASQLVTCVSSISTNIAEGFASDSTAEYCRFVNIARKSTSEAQNWFLKLGDSGKLRAGRQRAEQCEEISKMLWSLRESLRRRIERGEGKGRRR